MKTDLQRFQTEAFRWSRRQFGEHMDPTGSIAHLLREVEELRAAPDDPEEYADCLMLVCDAASRAGISLITYGFENRLTIENLARRARYLQEQPDEPDRYRSCADAVVSLAWRAGIRESTLLDAAWDKLDVNRNRKWGKPDADGVVEHVRNDGEEPYALSM